MALTQTQLDEAMKPGQFDSRASVGNHASAEGNSSMSSSSILTKDKPFSSAASPVNSLLAGEKIQFGEKQINSSDFEILLFLMLQSLIFSKYVSVLFRCSHISNNTPS